jgi:DNA polymerase-3 subunit epsilon
LRRVDIECNAQVPVVSLLRQKVDGKSVCFTGALQCYVDGHRVSRERAQELAAQRGMIVKAGVSKALDYLVVADPDSQSSKAIKARALGVRIVAERVFWGMLGFDVA